MRERLKEKTATLTANNAEVLDLKKSNKDLDNKFKRWVRLHEGHDIAKAFKKSKSHGKITSDRTPGPLKRKAHQIKMHGRRRSHKIPLSFLVDPKPYQNKQVAWIWWPYVVS